MIFLLAPIIFFCASILPVTTCSSTSPAHILPFLLASDLCFLIGTWGVSNTRRKAGCIGLFPATLRVLWTVLRGKQIKFLITPKQRRSGRFGHRVLPELTIGSLTVVTMD